jgi:hypothetical protein
MPEANLSQHHQDKYRVQILARHQKVFVAVFAIKMKMGPLACMHFKPAICTLG